MRGALPAPAGARREEFPAGDIVAGFTGSYKAVRILSSVSTERLQGIPELLAAHSATIRPHRRDRDMTQACLTESAVSSLIEAAYHEARRHQWIESQKQDRDLGETAFRDWYRSHWWSFLRHRHIEHLMGERQWAEFEGETFGRLAPLLDTFGELADEIIEQYRTGRENLDIINWALHYQRNIDSVYECLFQINMNDARIHPTLTGTARAADSPQQHVRPL